MSKSASVFWVFVIGKWITFFLKRNKPLKMSYLVCQTMDNAMLKLKSTMRLENWFIKELTTFIKLHNEKISVYGSVIWQWRNPTKLNNMLYFYMKEYASQHNLNKLTEKNTQQMRRVIISLHNSGWLPGTVWSNSYFFSF